MRYVLYIAIAKPRTIRTNMIQGAVRNCLSSQIPVNREQKTHNIIVPLICMARL